MPRTLTPPRRPLASIAFSTDDFREGNRFDAWQEAMAPMFDLGNRQPDTDFVGRAHTWLAGPLAFGGTEVSQLSYSRSQQRVRKDMIDHFLIRLDFDAANPEGLLRIIDLGQPIDLPPAPMNCLCIFVPRDTMRQHASGIEALHGSRPNHAGAGLLASHMKTLDRLAKDFTLADQGSIVDLTMKLMAACLTNDPRMDESHRKAVDTALLDRACAILEANIGNPNFTPDQLALTLGLSRSSLYRIFEPLGGVERYLRDRRLRFAYSKLTARYDEPDWRGAGRIALVAYAAGFSSEAAFTRAFRQRYGHTPSDLRIFGSHLQANVDTVNLRALSPPERRMMWGEWMQQLA